MDKTLERILSLIPKKPDGSFVHGAKKQFAESIGFKGGEVVTMWINGSSVSYRNKLHEIAAVYSVSVDWLKGTTDKKSPPPWWGAGTRKWMRSSALRLACPTRVWRSSLPMRRVCATRGSDGRFQLQGVALQLAQLGGGHVLHCFSQSLFLFGGHGGGSFPCHGVIVARSFLIGNGFIALRNGVRD